MFGHTYTICYRERADKGTHIVQRLLEINILKENFIARNLKYYLGNIGIFPLVLKLIIKED